MATSGSIEGIVYKWTNYWGGWQPRWLVLHNGILSYYNSEEEVGKGCRASIKISASDIVAYPTDNTRFDIVVQNEQRWYLKTSNTGERQGWIIALGTSKASSSDGITQNNQESIEAQGELRTCMSEVRLFCDLLVQQAVNVKQEAQKDQPDVEKLSDASTLLSTTCDTFLATLGRCLNISETVFELPSSPGRMIMRSQSEQSALPQINMAKSKHKKRYARSGAGTPPSPIHNAFNQSLASIPPHSMSPDNLNQSQSGNSESSSINSLTLSEATDFRSSKVTRTLSSPANTGPGLSNNLTLDIHKHKPNENSTENNVDYIADDSDMERMLTFFSAMLHSFSDISLEEDGGIPTMPFLSACEGIVPFLDTIGSTAFAPVKMDFMGNIGKLRTKYTSEVSKFETLQAILNQEICTATTKVRNSATDALMWLKRGLRFIQKFLVNFKSGERNLTLALNSAYASTLKVYHGWVVKGIFALAVKAAPYPKDFIRALAPNPDNADDKRFISILLQDIDQYTTAMDVVLNIIDNFYEEHDLESTAVV
uniref:Pleckstrin homology domain-containing family A member 8 n=1 Tax=Phallusia mammillata TaxID=59560 RepID=A0A6F9DPH8_9ASCI|nr:pleckstrin homology domain-containing family A member 8-like [Phallusia mammillata]